MMNVDLVVNNLSIKLGMPLSPKELKAAGIRRVGFLTKIFMRNAINEGEVVFWEKNTQASFFDGHVKVIPKVGVPGGDSDTICGSSIFLFFRDGRLNRVIYQVFGSYYWTYWFKHDFHARNNKFFNGEERFPLPDPDFSNLSMYYKRLGNDLFLQEEHTTAIWSDESEILMLRVTPPGESLILEYKLA